MYRHQALERDMLLVLDYKQVHLGVHLHQTLLVFLLPDIRGCPFIYLQLKLLNIIIIRLQPRNYMKHLMHR